ncbi:MAG: GSCFA domain-containing protein [Rhodospirillales bacterium]|nr:GSCFA domain-containing protein [Rhodospirillales bacterium]
MAAHPYRDLPAHRLWRQAIAGLPGEQVDPVVQGAFRIQRDSRVATAGSCFAQHIARHLAQAGLHHLVTEPAHSLVAPLAREFQYGVYSARYGNIYTARQLLQTLRRAYGQFAPRDDAWPAADGRVIDPYRPRIQPEGFATLAELQEDRAQHHAAIRRMVAEMDVFIFTLGLTEAWCNRQDGAIYPLCPGVAGGEFQPERHGFLNFRAAEVVADLGDAIALIGAHNPAARVILTVSPVPLIATMEERSVLTATTYSKAVLRVAAEEVAAAFPQVAYFPAYEIITGPHARGLYFDDTLRDVTEAGIAHVMRLFLRHYVAAEALAAPAAAMADPAAAAAAAQHAMLSEAAAVLCDEALLDRGDGS